jgi:hypothetical protein
MTKTSHTLLEVYHRCAPGNGQPCRHFEQCLTQVRWHFAISFPSYEKKVPRGGDAPFECGAPATPSGTGICAGERAARCVPGGRENSLVRAGRGPVIVTDPSPIASAPHRRVRASLWRLRWGARWGSTCPCRAAVAGVLESRDARRLRGSQRFEFESERFRFGFARKRYR